MIDVGYHGTAYEYAESIIKTRKMKFSSGYDEWLGRGIYFFGDIEDAKWWCKTRKYSDHAIIKADFEFNNKVIDLVMCRYDQECFQKYCNSVQHKSELLPNGKRRRNYMQLAINKLLEDSIKSGFIIDAIIAIFRENRYFWPNREFYNDQFPCLIGQLQICVFNHDAIKQLSIIEEEALIG